MKHEMKRKGFTLVELLIVIVVIGVLSAMMMLSSTEAVSSAKASNIISNLRNLKTAALAYYADNLDTAEKIEKDKLNDNKEAILKYLNNADKDSDGYKDYEFKNSSKATEWYVACKVSDLNVQGKLAGRAESVGLLKSEAQKADSAINKYEKGSAENLVYMFVR